MVLAWSYSSAYCQNNSLIPLRGNDTIVNVRIDLIRKANVKLIEHKYCPNIIATKDSIIKLERLKYSTIDSLYKANYVNCYNNVRTLEKQVAKTKRRNKILGGTVGCSIAIVVLSLLLK